jgi:atypical dual specificity phosphatase
MTTGAPIPDSYWLLQDRLLAGEYPGASSAATARAKLESFLDAGIRSFIDLTQEKDRLEPYDALLEEMACERRIEYRYQRFGIRDLGVPTREEMASILAAIRDEISAGRPVYFHCWGGIGRTGTVAGCWLVEQGLSGNDAIERIKQLRRGTPDGHRWSPETAEQEAFIKEWGGSQW